MPGWSLSSSHPAGQAHRRQRAARHRRARPRQRRLRRTDARQGEAARPRSHDSDGAADPRRVPATPPERRNRNRSFRTTSARPRRRTTSASSCSTTPASSSKTPAATLKASNSSFRREPSVGAARLSPAAQPDVARDDVAQAATSLSSRLPRTDRRRAAHFRYRPATSRLRTPTLPARTLVPAYRIAMAVSESTIARAWLDLLPWLALAASSPCPSRSAPRSSSPATSRGR